MWNDGLSRKFGILHMACQAIADGSADRRLAVWALEQLLVVDEQIYKEQEQQAAMDRLLRGEDTNV